ncbi:MAG: M48 family metalloprotease, partial [Bryobacteraceae bacterium]
GIAAALLAGTSWSSDPDLLTTDIQLGLQRHRQILERWRLLDHGEAADLVVRVGLQLAQAPGFNAPVPLSLYLVDDPEINAFATGGGRVYVTAGMLAALQGSDGMLAFVLGHEIAHNALQHGAKRVLRHYIFEKAHAEMLARCRREDNPACLTAAGAAQVAFLIAEKKRERDEEHEADRLGMMAAAEAGYHPNFAVLVARRLREVTGERSKFAAFFSTHPRWTTREERALRHYAEARQVFERRWPIAGFSPGGAPPPLAVLSKPEVRKDRGLTRIRAVLSRYDAGPPPATVHLQLIGEQTLPHKVFGDRQLDPPQLSPHEIVFELPKDFARGIRGKVWARLVVYGAAGLIHQSHDVRLR